MTTASIQVLDNQGNENSMTMEDFQKILKYGNSEQRNFRVFQINKLKSSVLILERLSGVESRYNARNGILMYEFHLGKKNTVLFGKIYSPDGKMFINVSEYMRNEIDQIRFGRVYKKVIIEYI
jgi:hypothetical protein